MKIPSFKILLFLIVALFFATQETRFENAIAVQRRGNIISARVHADSVAVATPDGVGVVSIQARMQRSMVATTAVGKTEIRQSGKILLQREPWAIYLWGRDIAGSLLTSACPSFQATFGDWTMDRFKCETVGLYREPLNSDFDFDTTIYGRGYYSLEFSFADGTAIALNLNDGFIDNDVSFCTNGNCPNDRGIHKSFGTNVRRFLNFFFEAALLASLLALILKLIIKNAHRDALSSARASGTGERAKVVLISVSLLTLAHLSACIWMSRDIAGSTPHISDSAVYYRQAAVLSHGQLLSDPLPSKPYEAFLSNSSEVKNDRINYFHANHFWPALLAVAIRIQAADLLSPVLSAFSLIAIYLLLAAWHSPRCALIAAVLYGLSPFALILSSDYMLHIPTQAALLLALVLGTKSYKNNSTLAAAASGLIWAYAFGLRPVPAVAVFIPTALLIVSDFRKFFKLKLIVAFALGAMPMVVVFVLDNYAVTGVWFTPPHQAIWGRSLAVRNLPAGTGFVDETLGYLPSIIFGFVFPQLWLGLIALPFFISSINRLTLWLLSCFLLLTIIHCLFDDMGLHGYGPRFLFEAIWQLYALAAIAIYEVLLGLPGWKRLAWATAVSSLLIFQIHALQTILPRYRNYNALDSQLTKKLASYDLDKCIFIIRGENWQAMDVAATLFDPTFQHGIFVRELPGNAHREVVKHFPNRLPVLVANDYVGSNFVTPR